MFRPHVPVPQTAAHMHTYASQTRRIKFTSEIGYLGDFQPCLLVRQLDIQCFTAQMQQHVKLA